MAANTRRAWQVAAVVLVGLGLVRLIDAFGKAGLQAGLQASAGRWQILKQERDSLAAVRRQLALEEQFLERRLASIAGGDPYLIINRSEQKLQLAIGNKIVLETGYRLAGPVQAGLARLPVGTLEVLAVSNNTDWYRPDWVYEKHGQVPPKDSASRVVPRAFGAGEIFLGGDIVIHGKVREAVAAEAVEGGYIELPDAALRSVVSAVRKGTTVLIH